MNMIMHGGGGEGGVRGVGRSSRRWLGSGDCEDYLHLF